MPEPTPTTSPNPQPHRTDTYQAVPQYQEDNQDEPEPTTQREGKLWSALAFLKPWVWEVAGILVSAVLIISIVIILAQYDGQRQPSWGLISLNSLVSWLSTLSKACVLFSVSDGIGQMKWVWFSSRSRPLSDLDTFDSASRGVTGSAALIWLVKGRNLAAIGSLAMILSIGFDPFIQNLVHYVPHNIEDPSEVSLLASTRVYNTVGPLSGGSAFFVDPILKANVYSALFNLDPSQPWAMPQYTCPTGNCTWDALASLEISASCSNITSELKTTCFETKDWWNNTWVSIPNCTVSLNSGVALWYLPSGGNAQPVVMETLVASSNTTHKTSEFPVIQYIMANGSNLKPEAGAIHMEIDNNTQFIATECVLQPLVRSFKALVNMGVYQERQLAEWADVNSTSDDIYQFSLNPSWNETFGTKKDETFGMTFEAKKALSGFVDDLFSGYAVAHGDSFVFRRKFDVEGIYATSDALQAIFYNNLTNSNCPVNDQLTCAMQNVASAISKTIRDTAFTGNVSYEPPSVWGEKQIEFAKKTTTGRTMVTVTYISIHWMWLALPVAVWFLGSLSCICSAWSTHRVHIQTWMNSVLPLATRPYGNKKGAHESQDCSDSEIGISSGQNAERRDGGRYPSLLCYDESLEEHVQRARQTHAKLEARNPRILSE